MPSCMAFMSSLTGTAVLPRQQMRCRMVPLLLGLKICVLLCLWVEPAVPRIDVLVFSGGSAWNGLANVLSRDGFRCAYILPVTDDGGSTREIRRVFGGPAIGDMRSRLSVLESPGASGAEKAMLKLLRLRLNEDDEARARAEWQALLKEDHSIWKDASAIEQSCCTVSSCAVLTNDQPSPAPPRRKWNADQDMRCARQMLRLFDAHISHSEDLASNSSNNSSSRSHRQRASTTHDLQLANANIGNLLLTTLRLCLGNLEAAVDWIANASGVQAHSMVLASTIVDDDSPPCCKNFFRRHEAMVHVGAETRVDEDSPFGHGAMSESDGSCHGVEMARCGEDGCNDSSELGNGGLLGIGVKLIDGQTLIGQSAISHPMTPVPSKPVASKLLPAQRQAIKMAKMRRSLSVDKGLGSISQPLPAPVDRLFYVRGNTQVSSPACNPRIPPLLREASLVVLGPGSLFTSLIASLVLPGVGEAMAAARGRATRVLALNSGPDRESGSMPASGFVECVVGALSRYGELDFKANDVLDAVLVSQNSAVDVDDPALVGIGIDVIRLPCICPSGGLHTPAQWHEAGELCPQVLRGVIEESMGSRKAQQMRMAYF